MSDPVYKIFKSHYGLSIILQIYIQVKIMFHGCDFFHSPISM